MKMWQRISIVSLVVILIASAVFFFDQEEKACCLCDSFRYHAPCLIDLEAGKMIELDLYFSHPTKVAELADPQPEMSAFSFVRLEGVAGTKLTDSKTIEIDVPVSEKTADPVLCQDHRKQIDGIIVDRYILADLYDREEKILIPIDAGLSMVLRCYEITVQEKGQGISNVVIQGILE